MKKNISIITLLLLQFFCISNLYGQNDNFFKVFCFPSDKIPQIDGDISDWDIVPEKYLITIDSMTEDEGNYMKPDKTTVDI